MSNKAMSSILKLDSHFILFDLKRKPRNQLYLEKELSDYLDFCINYFLES
jgi:hypothetical protein